MTLIQSKYAKGLIPIPYPAFAGAVVAHRYWHQLATAPAANDILELAALPHDCRVVDVILDSDDMDSGATLAFDVGVMSGDFGDNDPARTIGNEFFAASNVAQAGGVARPTKKEAFRTAPVGSDRSIGLKFTAAATGFASGIIGLTVLIATV